MHLSCGLGDLNTTGGTEGSLDIRVDSELESGEGSDHEETGTDTTVRATETELFSDLDKTAGGGLAGSTGGLVDFGQHGISGLRDDGGGETGDETSAKVGTGLGGAGEGVLGEDGEDRLGRLLEDDELGHGVRDLLEEDGPESRVESTETLLLVDLGETAEETGREGGLRDETDTGGLEGAERDIGEELGETGRRQVDGGAVVGSVLQALWSLC